MKFTSVARWLALATVVATLAGTTSSAADSIPPSDQRKPVGISSASASALKKDDGRFLKLHESFLARARRGPTELLFIGDSITEGWSKAPHIWEHFYGSYLPANFGIGGDQTQNLIWRIENGELEGIDPRVVVLMIGSNNTANHTAGQISEAITKIVGMIREKLPRSRVLLLAIFPRGSREKKDGTFDDGVKRIEVIRAVNTEIAKLDDGKNVRYLNINDVFLGQDDKIPFSLMRDQLHPTAAGYQLWAEAMHPLLTEMMQ